MITFLAAHDTSSVVTLYPAVSGWQALAACVCVCVCVCVWVCSCGRKPVCQRYGPHVITSPDDRTVRQTGRP